jgi:hypothetical protein
MTPKDRIDLAYGLELGADSPILRCGCLLPVLS